MYIKSNREGLKEKTNLSLHELNELGEWKRGFVDFAHKKPLKDHSIELAAGSPYQKPV